MEIIRIIAGIYAANCYIVYSKETGKGLIVDPGGDVDEIVRLVKDRDIQVTGIVLTHGHADHIGGLKDLKEKFDVDIMIHEDDREMLVDANINLSNMMSMDSIELNPDRILKDGDIIHLDDNEILVIHTPGHTRGGICLKIGDNIITGDTLFQGSIGRTDLFGGDFDSIINSIKTKLMMYKDEIKIFPGHGAPSTIGYERSNNPYLK